MPIYPIAFQLVINPDIAPATANGFLLIIVAPNVTMAVVMLIPF